VHPYTQDANHFFISKDFVHDAVLNIDAVRICASNITCQFLEGWWVLKRVDGNYCEQALRF